MIEKDKGLVVRVHKAEAFPSDEDVTSGTLHAELPLPGLRGYGADSQERRRDLFDEDAAKVVDFLSSTLPSGVYDRVIGLLLAGKASDLIISYRQIEERKKGPPIPSDKEEHAVFLSQLRLSLGLTGGSKPTTIEEESALIEEVDRLVSFEKLLRIKLGVAGGEDALFEEVDRLVRFERKHVW